MHSKTKKLSHNFPQTLVLATWGVDKHRHKIPAFKKPSATAADTFCWVFGTNSFAVGSSLDLMLVASN